MNMNDQDDQKWEFEVNKDYAMDSLSAIHDAICGACIHDDYCYGMVECYSDESVIEQIKKILEEK